MSTEDGKVEMTLGIENGQVIQHFQNPMQTIRYDPENAVAIAMRITDLAFEADSGMKPVGDTLKAELIEQHRIKLIQRIALMLGSMRNDKKKSDGYLAKELVETFLREIF